jgi:hypothetical protein
VVCGICADVSEEFAVPSQQGVSRLHLERRRTFTRKRIQIK